MIKFIFNAEEEKDSFFGSPQIWDNTLKFFGFSEKDYVYIDNTKREEYASDPTSRPDMISALKTFPKGTKIYFSEFGEFDLKDFKHPDDAIYIFGRDGGKINGKDQPPLGVDITIKIPNVKSLWGIEALSILMWDRYIKHGTYGNL